VAAHHGDARQRLPPRSRRFAGAGARLPNRAAPLLGADTDAILGDLGYDTNEISRLRAGGIV
jgi:crotonobetainyl-CoA:carnitine CoA-transferase CaiB-like acyl-CoA transferase